MPESEPTKSGNAQVDEQKIARAASIGLPVVTVAAALVVAVVMGPATSILVLAAGLLLGVIALLWGSLRILSGDAPLSPELEALDMAAQGVDLLAGRKQMLLRALKDLENERGIGKLEEDDFAAISATYREELKVVLRRIDETLAPHRSRAEELAREHLAQAGLVSAEDGEVRKPGGSGEHAEEPAATDSSPRETEARARVTCPSCKASNEPDAKFCKECATRLEGSTSLVAAEVSDEE